MTKKNVVAISPYIHPHSINFKMAAYEAWKKVGGYVARSLYPVRLLHAAAFRWELPMKLIRKQEARLRFVEPISIKFDTFPDYARYEVIPFIWDCWPDMVEIICSYFIRHEVKTAFFTSSQSAELMRKRFPEMNIFYVPEGVDTSLYKSDKELKGRNIDLLEFGRDNGLKITLPQNVNHLYRKGKDVLFKTNEEFFAALADTKITIVQPRCDTDPDKAGNIETLTQRYWECMLSGIIPLGRAPKELIELIGYNPVIEIDKNHINDQIMRILNNIEDYKDLVDKNRRIALERGDWTVRMKQVMLHLKECGYTTKLTNS